MSLLALGEVAFGGTPAVVSFLQGKNLLAKAKNVYMWDCDDHAR